MTSIHDLTRELDLHGESGGQKMWVNNHIFEILEKKYRSVIEDGYRVIKVCVGLYQFNLHCTDDIEFILSARLKNETIDEQIAHCEKDCKEEYDECCRVWKGIWTSHDEALKTGIADLKDYFK